MWVEVRPASTKTVGLNYWDIVNNEQVAEGSVTVDADATNVNTSTFTDIPEGYELVWTGDLHINDGWVWVEVRPVSEDPDPETVTITVTYWDTEADKQVGESFTMEVAADANNINTSTLTNIPEGYELVWTGDVSIEDGAARVEVRPVSEEPDPDPETVTITVTYWDTEADKQVGESFTMEVAADATTINTSDLTNIPEGYELVSTGAVSIVDGAVRVEVKLAAEEPTTETFTVTFDSNGGSDVDSQTVKNGEKAVEPENPTRSGYRFAGWFSDEDLENEYDFDTPVTSDITLYADWDRRSTGGGSSGGSGSSSTSDRYTISVSCGEGGSISPDEDVEVREGRDQRFTITADDGYRISEVLVDGESVGAVDEYTFEDVDDDHEIEVEFARLAADPSTSGTNRYLQTEDHVQYMSGYPDGTFGPTKNMTRAEVAQMFYALLLDKNVPVTASFSDVPADAWYADAVNALASLGMVSGYSDGTFRPDAPITRAEFCVIALAFAYTPEDFECDFNDVAANDWFYDYVAQATSYGWISGASGAFRPNDAITRAEVTVIVNNMLGRAADQDYVDENTGDLNTFSDVTESNWAYYSIMETTNAHDYTKTNGNENWD